jgi:xanthine dehydrogenase accessory factor
MLFADRLVVVRGGGDMGTGAVFRLHKAGFPVVVLELAEPLSIRREVAVSTAVDTGAMAVDGMVARLVASAGEAVAVAATGVIAVLVAPELPPDLAPYAIVDARLAKQPLDTRRGRAPVVVGLGPGLTAGLECDAVVETQRGHDLGRVLWSGRAAPNTGVPGTVGGESARRVVRAPEAGSVGWEVAIGDRVEAGATLGLLNAVAVHSEISGVVRGLIAPGRTVAAGTKIADIDPRADRLACFSISDKALAVGGGVVEAVLTSIGG